MTLNVEEIVVQMDELVRLGQSDEYTGHEMAEALEELVNLIRPKEVKFSEVSCRNLDPHLHHLWTWDGRSQYCPGVE